MNAEHLPACRARIETEELHPSGELLASQVSLLREWYECETGCLAIGLPRIDAIRARLAAATPGPWEVEKHAYPRATMACHAPMGRMPLVHFPGREELFNEGFMQFWDRFDEEFDEPAFLVQRKADADLVGNAPADLAFLLAEVDRLRTRLDTASGSTAAPADHSAAPGFL